MKLSKTHKRNYLDPHHHKTQHPENVTRGMWGSEDKSSKEEANYRHADPPRNCGNCEHYNLEEGSCSVVEGNIHRSMVSDLWKGNNEINFE